jgi:hypothetical protein
MRSSDADEAVPASLSPLGWPPLLPEGVDDWQGDAPGRSRLAFRSCSLWGMWPAAAAAVAVVGASMAVVWANMVVAALGGVGKGVVAVLVRGG